MKMDEREFVEYLEMVDELEPEILEEGFNKIVTQTKCRYKDGISKLVFIETQIPFLGKGGEVYFGIDDVSLFLENAEGHRELVELI
jgi:hypothetical protein